MKKKLLATVLTAALALGAITGCGSQKTEETAATDSSAATTTGETTASTQEAVSGKRWRNSCSEAWSDRCYL